MSKTELPTFHVFYDYACPYAYVGWKRVEKLVREHPLQVVWLPWEIHPELAPAGMAREDGKAGQALGGWLGELASEVGAAPRNGPRIANTNLALRGAIAAQDAGETAFARYHAEAFRAVWERGEDLGRPETVIAFLRDAGVTEAQLDHPSYTSRLAAIDALATRAGIQRVPTFVFGDQRIVGNDRFEPSLRAPLAAFLERWKRMGPDQASTLAEDLGLPGPA